MNSRIRFIFSILLSTFFYLGNAQVANFTFTPPSGGCDNNVVNFSGAASNSTVATSFTFNGGALPAGWSSSPYTINATFCPGKNTPDNSPYFWATTTATSGPNTGQRFVQTNSLNVALGGTISFFLRYAADEAPSAGCEDPDAPSEEVYLQYSIDGGTSWVTIYDQWNVGPFTLPWYNWYAVNLPIPAAAQTASTTFRWYQPANSGDGFDNWGLEDINISSASSITAVSYAWDFGDATTANTENVTKTYALPAAGTTATYNVTLTAVFSDGSTDSEVKTYVVSSTAAAPTASAQSFCSTSGSTVANLVATGTNLKWFNVASGGTQLASSTSIATGTYYVSQTTANGCESPRTAVNVTVSFGGITVITQPVTVQLDAVGNASVTAAQVNNGSTASCGINTVTVSPSTFTCANVGANTVTLTVTDINGNIGTGTATITVQDTVLPTVITQNLTVQLNAAGNATITAAQINNGSNDNCGIATVTVLPNTFNCTNLGSNTVTLTVTDVNGNISTATATVTVRDQINPVVIAKNATLALGANGMVTLNPSLINNGSSDNCTFTLTATPNTFGAANFGPNTVILVGTDSSGDVSFATAIVTIIDNTPPTVLTQNITVQLDATGNATITAAQINNGSTDNTSIASISVAASAFTCANLGANTVTLTVTDLYGNVATNTAIVTVVDSVLPTITAPANIVTTTNTGCTATGVVLGTAVTADNCSVATVTNNAPTVFPLGVTMVTWTVTDGSGNIRTATQAVRVNDNVNPTITAPANVVVSANNSCNAVNVNLGTPVSADNCSVASVTNNGLSTYPLGTTTVTWTVTDGSGNTATVTQTVTVTDTTLPTIVAPAALTVSSSATCGVTGLALGTPFANDNCSVATVTNDAPTTFPLGNTTVTWTVTDGAGNIRTATQVVTVVDTTLPTITAPANIVTTTNTGCTATGVVLGTAVTADNCSVASVTNNAPAIFPLGTTTVTWTVTDGSGNIRTATQTVRVNDNVNPTITAPANVTVASNNNCVAVNVNLGTPVRADNCSVASVTNNGLSSYPIGVTIVTWTVTDGSGNTATSTQTVTVVDAVLPTIVAPAAINVNTNSTSCTATNVPLGFPVAIDNCSVASVTNNAPVAFPLGNTTVTWTVTDGSGSTATATQVVTVRDASAPVVITQNISAFLNAAGTVTITAAQVNNGSSDNCGIASVVVTPATFNCSKLGANVVTLIVTDVNGNVASGTAIVTVVDNLAPTAVTQNITAILNPNGQVTITAAMVNNGSFDNCSVASVALSKTVFECSNLGTNTVLFTVTDGSGNTTTVPVQVTVTKRFGDVDNVCGDININVSQAITPNGDGVNDTWMISNIESYPKNNVKVFNRWGSEVFSANGYRNDWNGHYKNSDQSLPDASSYYYQIDLDGDGTIEKDGWIYISRL